MGRSEREEVSKRMSQDLREALEAQISEWERTASQASIYERDTFNARCETYAKCADDLEELLQEQTDE